MAVVASLAMAVSLAACARTGQGGDAQTQVDMGTVRVFVPSDGVTVSQDTPVNKWGKFASAVVDRLKGIGFAAKDVKSAEAGTLADQQKDLAKYVDSIAGDTRRHTIVIAPVIDVDASTQRYGDLVRAQRDSSTGSSEGASSSGQSASDGIISKLAAPFLREGRDDVAATEAQMADTLNLAKQRGVHVVLVKQEIAGFVPDVFVSTASPYDIGVLQANELVSKLKVASASVDNPRRIEVLVPEGEDTDVAREAFRGVWSVLGQYYQNGKAVSPSGLLGETSGEDSWGTVTFRADDGDDVKDELRSRLGLDGLVDANGGKQTHVDGVLAMNDFVAYQVDQTLEAAGYVGSSADINPEITLGGIVDNIAGNQDVQRQKVPEPARGDDADGSDASGAQDGSGDSSSERSEADAGKAGKERAAQWPIITGFGSYVSNVPLVVNGKQWMTGLEDRVGLASGIAKVCGTYGLGQGALIGQGKTAAFDGDGNGAVDLDETDIGGIQVPTVSRPLVAVTGANLKKTVLDPGYVSAADAGL